MKQPESATTKPKRRLRSDRRRSAGARQIAAGLLSVVVAIAAVALPKAMPAQQPVVTIAAGKMLDGRGGSRNNVIITVRGSRIERIDARTASSPAPMYDLSAYTLLPGFVDVHSHVDWHFNAQGRYQSGTAGETPAQAMQAVYANLRATLFAGFTTIMSPGSPRDAAYRDSIAAGRVAGPRILSSLGQLQPGNRTPEQLRASIRQSKERGADFVKIFASASIRDGGTATATQEQMDAICGEAKLVGLHTMVHAHSAESITRTVLAGCNQIEHGIFATDVELRLMAERGVFFSPQCGLIFRNYLDNRAAYDGIGNYNAEGFAVMERSIPLAVEGYARALKTPGLNVVFGTDAVAGAHGKNGEDLLCRVQKAGDTPMNTIVGATSLSARAAGLANVTGALIPGLEADIIALQGDPLVDITAVQRVTFVMRAGTVYRNSTGEWPVYGGDAGAMKYSQLTGINRGNVAQLAPAWQWSTGESPIARTDSTLAATPRNFQATPIMFGDTLFLSTPYNRVVALDASTGREFWSYDPRAYELGNPPNGTGLVHRGVAAWTDERTGERRIFINSRWKLVSLDARTGKPVPGFGSDGVVDLTAALLWPVRKDHYTNTSPPVVYKDLVILGNGVGDRLVYNNDPPGDVQAFDARTGKRVWSFSPIPQAGEFGVNTWENESWKYTGHTNVWAPFSVDLARGLVYLPVGTPSNDWYGGKRLGDNLFAESIVCLDANTGARVWHFQTVRHGLWDYDIPAPPVLLTIRPNGQPVDAVAVPTKMGFLFVFDRVTGAPIWPIVDRAVPASDVPGERASATQPFPTRPAPFAQQGFTENDVIDFTPAIKALALAELTKYRSGPLFTPPSLQGTVTLPGSIGGSGWGGGAFDPESGVIYIKATNNPSLFSIRKVDQKTEEMQADYAVDLGNQSVGVRVDSLVRALGLSGGGTLPINKPPYGTLTAIDLNSGNHLWQVPVGDDARLRNHPLLRDLNLPPFGVTGAPGPIVTRGGLVFLTGGGSTLYAHDKTTGAVLWQHPLGRSGYSVPMTYSTRAGKQFVVIATGSGASATLMAFALPGPANGDSASR
jgi:quinoprotein glucose dehydrogenase